MRWPFVNPHFQFKKKFHGKFVECANDNIYLPSRYNSSLWENLKYKKKLMNVWIREVLRLRNYQDQITVYLVCSRFFNHSYFYKTPNHIRLLCFQQSLVTKLTVLINILLYSQLPLDVQHKQHLLHSNRNSRVASMPNPKSE